MKKSATRIFVLIAVILSTTAVEFAFCQTIPRYKSRLKEVESAKEFSSIFKEMMQSFHDGRLPFTHEDVEEIVNLSKEKSYADDVLSAVYSWAGTMYGDGRMHEAITYFMESASLYEQQKNSSAAALCYFEIALVQHKAENYAEAEEYYKKTLDVGKDSLEHRTVINCYNGLALILREEGKYDVAAKDFRKAYNIAVINRDTAWMAILSGNIGSIHYRQMNNDSSLYYYRRNLDLIKKTGEFENEIETYTNLAKVFLRRKEPRKALAFVDSSNAIIRDRKISLNDFFDPTDEINQTYALAYAYLGDYKKAFDYSTRFHEASQHKQERINGRSLKQLQMMYAFQQKQNEVELLQKVNAANVATIRFQRFTEIGFVVLIILISIIAYTGFRSSRRTKQLNHQLSTSNQELERLNKLKNRLFSVISHDLRTPINNLQSLLELYRSGDLASQDLHTLSGKLERQVTASGHVLENLLQWARAELSEAKANPVSVEVVKVVSHIFSQFDGDLKAKNIQCNNQVPHHINVWADRDQLEIVIRNLIANAIKFTKEQGVITIAASREGNEIRIEIRDNGVGMMKIQMEKLFQSETNVSTPGTNKEKGSGIGLLITKELVANNGGRIDVQSEKGYGTTFFIWLPADEPDTR